MENTIINLDYLHKTCGGSEEMVQMIIDIFISTTPDCMAELETHFSNADSEELRMVAHKVKSSFLTIGAKSAGEKLQQIEDAAKDSDISHLGPIIQQVINESDAIIQELHHKNNAVMKTNILKIFIVEDDPFYGEVVQQQLQTLENVEVTRFQTADEFASAKDLNPDVVVFDYDMPVRNGLQLLEEVKKINDDTFVVMLSGQMELNIVVDAYNKGADKYIIKDEKALVELRQIIENFRKVFNTRNELDHLKDRLIDINRYENLIGESLVMKEMFHLMEKVENINIPVLITGSNGTGKELVANALHYNSSRKQRQFVALNVAAIPEDLIESELFGAEKGAFTRYGKFEEANGGSIFLDEIGEMPYRVQAKLLRVLKENKVTRLGGKKEINLDIKVMSATNKDLWKEVEAGRFREDLYFRLQGFIIRIPDLKDRGNDVIHLAKHFASEFCKRQGLPEKQFEVDAFKAMIDYRWPGNVRELKSMVEHAVLISNQPKITSENLVFLEKHIA
ncbi:MAG: regulator [Fluviicola sp. XM-24bin1]|nr:MAG: regulator [Fluviicola sp. XM-24bin1]